MSIAYMLALEAEPSTYEQLFTALTRGVNKEIQERILDQVTPGMQILEVGCGPGTIAKKVAEKGGHIIAFDSNLQMVIHAIGSIDPEIHKTVKFQLGSATNLPEEIGQFDLIISTFMLSELRPFEQQIFLRKAWEHLKPKGRLIFADEFMPHGLAKIKFLLKRWWYLRKLKRKRSGLTHPLNWLFNYLPPIGFEIQTESQWAHGSIRLVQAIKKDGSTPGYYRPVPHIFTGIKAKARIVRCIFTGQIDHVAIEPGIYESGKPTSESPIIVTTNYELTYIRVMNDLKGVDAWVLCVDSNGINVWCAARGNHFGNKELIEAINATNILQLVNHRTLLLPQLAAGGVSVPSLPPDLNIKIKYGPIWSKYLKSYLQEKPARKPEEMRLAKFVFSKRLEAGVTHLTFLLRKFMLWPSIFSVITLLVLMGSGINSLQFISWTFFSILGWIWLGTILTNLIIAIIFPIVDFTPVFMKKGIFLSAISSIISIFPAWLLFPSLFYTITNLVFLFWLGFFSTMSFSGYTMASSPRQIKLEYAKFTKINQILLILVLFLYISTVVWDVIQW
jgi:ubiquinone/menaquinone biosynthesis C-methylase UbiE